MFSVQGKQLTLITLFQDSTIIILEMQSVWSKQSQVDQNHVSDQTFLLERAEQTVPGKMRLLVSLWINTRGTSIQVQVSESQDAVTLVSRRQYIKRLQECIPIHRTGLSTAAYLVTLHCQLMINSLLTAPHCFKRRVWAHGFDTSTLELAELINPGRDD